MIDYSCMTPALYLMSVIIIAIGALLIVRIASIRLRVPATFAPIPACEHLTDLATWLRERELAVGNVIPGAEACIQFANPIAPARTALAFVYVHGFSATWPETAPVTGRLAAAFGANVLQTRLAGHGTEPESLATPAEAWLTSLHEAWQIAGHLGDRVVIVATSTGAPLAIWLARLPGVADRLHALLFMSPNFRIRSHLDFLLTAPGARYWLHLLIGRYRQWQPINAAQARYWTWRYSTRALIEMQKCVDFARRQDLSRFTTPLAVMYMREDPTIRPDAAIAAFRRWGADTKTLIPVTLDGDEPAHVFAGDICGPHRTDWTVARFEDFLRTLDAAPSPHDR